jgi:hypothetical protein
MMWMMIMGSNHWWLIVMGIRKHYFLYRVYLFRKKRTFFFNFWVTFHTKYIYFFLWTLISFCSQKSNQK